MVSRAGRTGRYMKHEDSTIGVGNFVDIHSESNRLKQLLGHRERITERLSPDNWTGVFVTDAEDQIATTFICDGHTVAMKPLIIELILGLFKLEALMLLRHRSP